MGFFLEYAWLIPLFPLLGCILITLPPIRQQKWLSAWLAIGLMVIAVVFALGLFAGVVQGAHLLPDGSVEIMHADEHGAAESHGEAAAEHAEAHDTGFVFPEANVVRRIAWAPTGTSSFNMGIYIDPIAATMLVMVTITSTCIHLFSLGYMAAHTRQSRFFSFISLFTAAMLLMVMAGDLLLFFIAWEVMGLCSYLLIGFLFERPQAYRAGLKAFITTRIGDVLMLIGLVYLYTQAGSLEFGMATGQLFNPELLEHLGSTIGVMGLSHATAIALLIFCGTVGKSAQFPLHVWLPDAMEGPTPVSALIHAATMVSAGVYLVGRTYPLFTADDGSALAIVAFIGAFTALFAALIAVSQFDIKRILAYSTLSQLGFMVAALGIGGWVAGMFHLLTHAFFKALLFLGSGSVIHAMEATPAIEKIHHRDEYAAQQTAQDIRNMGDLRRFMPWTFWTYTAGYLALAGVIPFAGFWSKDEILVDALKHGAWVVLIVLVLASFLTAFYMTRQWRTVFFGTYRGDDPIEYHNTEPAAYPDHDDHHGMHHNGHDDEHHGQHSSHGHPHESPWTIVVPLVVLAFFAVVAGFFNLPFDMPGGHWLAHLWAQQGGQFNIIMAGIALLVAAAGIAAGWHYSGVFATARDPEPLEKAQPVLFQVLYNKGFIDELYAATIGQLSNALAVAWNWIDQKVLDRLVDATGVVTFLLGRLNFIIDDTLFNDGPDGLANGTLTGGKGVREVQTGKIHDYITYIVIGVVVLALFYLYGIQQ